MPTTEPEQMMRLRSASGGLTDENLRDLFAAAYLAGSDNSATWQETSQHAYRMADAMMEARKKLVSKD